MATNDGGAGPTDFSGVTYLGKPSENSSDSYHIKRSSGKVLGPFDGDLIVQMIRGEKLGGDEGVSSDGTNWIPILAVPRFAEAFKQAGRTSDTLFGVQAVGSPTPGTPSGEEETVVTDRDELGLDAASDGGAPMFPPRPLDESGLGVTEDSTMTLASGSWATMDDDGLSEQSLSEIIVPTGSPSQVSGVRQLSGAAAGVSGPADDDRGDTDMGSPNFGEPKHSTTELPTPRGFTHFPGGGQELPVFPSDDEVLSGLAQSEGLSADDAPEPVGFRDLPSDSMSNIGALGDDGELPVSSGRADLPVSAGREDLPVSAGREDLPISAGSDLPQSAGTNLPQSAGTNLPQSAGENLPGATGTSLPSPRNLPQSTEDAGGDLFGSPTPGEGGSQFGTMAMSGIGDAELPASQHQFDLGEFAEEGGGPELPASSRDLGGASVLDEMAESDDIWAAPDESAPVQDAGGRSFGARPGGAPSFATEEIGFDASNPFAESDAGPGEAGGGPSSEFEDFFPGGDAPAETAEAPSSLTEIAQSQSQPAAASPAPRKSSGGGGAVKAIAGVAVIGALAAGGWFAFQSMSGGETEQVETVQVEPTTPTQVRAVEVAGVDTLYTGSYDDYVLYFGDARTAVDQRGAAEDRAKLVIAGSLLRAEHPSSGQAASDLADQVTRLRAESEPTPLVTLAIGAWEAVTGDPAAPETLAPVRRGEYAGLANLFTGLSNVQRYRGARPEVAEEAAAPAPAPTPAADGSGEAAAAAADPEEVAPADGEVAAAEPMDELDEAPAATAEEMAVLEEQVPLDAASIEAFEAAASAQPDLVSAYYWQGWSALELGRADGAASAFEAALERNEAHVPSHIGAARALLAQGRLADADGRILQVIDERGNDSSAEQRADAFVAAAEVSIARLQPEVAIESLLSALQVDPTNTVAIRMLGDQFYRAGLYQRAIEYFETNADLGAEDPEGVLGLARARIGLDMLAEAQSTLEAAMDDYPRDARFPYYLGQVFERQAEYDLARQYYRQALQIDPDYALPYVALARLAERANDPTQAMEHLAEAFEVNADDAAMANEVGEMYLRLGETNRAVSAFRRALEFDGSHPDARINLTEYYLNTGQQERAIAFIDEMTDAGIESPRLEFLSARALHGKGEYDEGITRMLTLLEGDPENPDYLYMLGLLHFDAGNYESSREQFSKAFEESPNLDEALYYVGRADLALGATNDAIASLTTVSQRSTDGRYHYWLGVALEEGLQPMQALDAYGQAIEKDIAWSLEHPDVFFRRGKLLYARGFGVASYRDIRTMLTLVPEHAGAHWYLGQVYYDDREYSASIQSIMRSLELDPEQPAAHYRLGLAYLRLLPQDLESAIQHFETAREAGYGERRADLFQRLAYAYRDLGRNGDAAGALQAYMEHAQLPYDEQRETENEIQRLQGLR